MSYDKGLLDPSSATYFNLETLLNDITRLALASGTKRAWAVAVLDSAGNQTDPIGSAGTVIDGTKTVITAGTRVQLSTTSVPCKRVFIQARDNNGGTIVVGAITCVAALATRRGAALFSSQGDWFNVNNLNLLYIDSTNSGDKINFFAET